MLGSSLEQYQIMKHHSIFRAFTYLNSPGPITPSKSNTVLLGPSIKVSSFDSLFCHKVNKENFIVYLRQCDNNRSEKKEVWTVINLCVGTRLYTSMSLTLCVGARLYTSLESLTSHASLNTSLTFPKYSDSKKVENTFIFNF